MRRSGIVMTATGPLAGHVEVEGDRIVGLEPDGTAGGDLLLPGFVDLHCHGGGGHDIMDAGDAATGIAAHHAKGGTTSLLATTLTAPPERLRAALDGIAAAMVRPEDGTAQILGVHLEGPFISPAMLGAQPPYAREVEIALLEDLCARAPVQIITFAPEADPDGRLLAFACARGIRAQLGHSPCRYEDAAQAFAQGASGVTHLFNAMSGLHHRAPGLAGAALAHASHAELIPDLLHVHPGAIRAALRAIPGLYAVTDATRAAGMPDGTYPFGDGTAEKCRNGLRLPDGTLAGSCLTMIEAFRNLVTVGLSPAEAAHRCATVPADYLGLPDRGRLGAGAIADLVVLGPDLSLKEVVLRGTSMPG